MEKTTDIEQLRIFMKYNIKSGDLDEEGLCKYFELRKSPIAGNGLFATKPVEAGTIVWIGSLEKDTIQVAQEEVDDTWIALRDIPAEDEITYDYALTDAEDDGLAFDCKGLNETNCRGRFTPEDYKLPSVRKKYAGHFSSPVQKAIDRYNAQGMSATEKNELIVMERQLEI